MTLQKTIIFTKPLLIRMTVGRLSSDELQNILEDRFQGGVGGGFQIYEDHDYYPSS